MTQSIDIPQNVGRNDPCPCGSKKKYKKCHMRIHQAMQEERNDRRDPNELIDADTHPYAVLDLIREASSGNLVGLLYDLMHDQGPWRASFTDKNDFLRQATEGKLDIPADARFELLRYRLDDPDTHILLARGIDDAQASQVSYQLITLRHNDHGADNTPRETDAPGYRIWDVQHLSRPKTADSDMDMHLSTLDVGWHPRDKRAYPTRDRAAMAREEEE